ncbi:MAG: hypothetical protein AAF560_33845 [Acidobacteriota bacterium]
MQNRWKRLVFAIVLLALPIVAIASGLQPAADSEPLASEPTLAPSSVGVPLLADAWAINRVGYNLDCVETTCAYDFICYETCAAGPEDEFCRCVRRCILFCA